MGTAATAATGSATVVSATFPRATARLEAWRSWPLFAAWQALSMDCILDRSSMSPTPKWLQTFAIKKSPSMLRKFVTWKMANVVNFWRWRYSIRRNKWRTEFGCFCKYLIVLARRRRKRFSQCLHFFSRNLENWEAASALSAYLFLSKRKWK